MRVSQVGKWGIEIMTSTEIEFSSLEDCTAWLMQSLQWKGSDNSLQLRIGESFASTCELNTEANSKTLELRFRKWVIREKDIKLFEALSSAIAAVVSAKFALNNINFATLSGFVIGVLKILRDVHSSYATLSDNQLKLVVVLERYRGQPISKNDLVQILVVDELTTWTEQLVSTELATLCELPTNKGYLKLVEQNKDGQWLLADR